MMSEEDFLIHKQSRSEDLELNQLPGLCILQHLGYTWERYKQRTLIHQLNTFLFNVCLRTKENAEVKMSVLVKFQSRRKDY